MTGDAGFIGIANTGSGRIDNHGPQAFGPGSTAIGVPGAQTRPEHALTTGARPSPDDVARGVFVVHGRDEQLRSAMFDLLRKLGLVPREWESLVAETGEASPFLGQVVARATQVTRAALVLLSPDDIVTLHPGLHARREARHEVEPGCQARPNVLVELGMALIAYPERTVIVECGAMRPIADLNGRNVIRFDGSVAAIRKLARRLSVAGCAVDESGTDWLNPQPFEDLTAYRRAPV